MFPFGPGSNTNGDGAPAYDDTELRDRVQDAETGIDQLAALTAENAGDIQAVETRTTEVEDRVTVLEGAPAPASMSDRWDLHSFELITVSGTWSKATSLGALIAAHGVDNIRVELDLVGGGASGGPGLVGTSGHLGGSAGSVTCVGKTHPDDLAATVPAVIGAGGAASLVGAANNSGNAGGNTSFGTHVAFGAAPTVSTSPISLFIAVSSKPSARPGDASTTLPSIGPGPGGSSGSSAGGSPASAGGDGGADNTAYRTVGGAPRSADGNTAPQNGQSANGAYGFGAGGGAARTGNILAGAGGFPGGGGGGGGYSASNGTPTGGAGGNGAVRIRKFVRRGT